MSPRRCLITDCKSQSNLPEHSGVRFHAFPSNVVVRKVWIENCRIPSSRSVTKSDVICSRHFVESDFQPVKNGKRLLKNGSVPTVFSWSDVKTLSDVLTAASEAEEKLDASTAESVADTSALNETIKTPANVKPASKKSNTRSKAVSAVSTDESLKKRSASAEEQSTSDANAKTPKPVVRKSLDSATPNTPEKTPALNVGKSPAKRYDVAATFVPGTKVEVQDVSGSWHNASVVEVDQTEQEVLINFEKSAKASGPTLKLNDEWIAMDSSRLRPLRPVPDIQFVEGEKCLARWTDSRKFAATVVKVLDNKMYEVLFDDGFLKKVKGIHMSKLRRPTGDKLAQHEISSPPPLPQPVVLPIVRKPSKPNPIPKFDLSKFNLPEIPSDGEWCCQWVNDTPIGREGHLLNADGNKRPTVLVDDWRLPAGWTKHLYQRSSTSGKWDVVLVGPNNKRFRSKNDVKVYLEEKGQSYNPDVYDFSIHKRRAKDIGVYVYTDDYVPPVIPKPASDLSKFDTTFSPSSSQEFKQEPFTGFSPSESTSSILSKIKQEIKTEPGTPVAFPLEVGVHQLEAGFTHIGALKVQIKDNLFCCPKEGCNKTFRKENHLQIHVKHYHDELSKQLGACPNMTELAYFRTMGTPIDEASPKNLIPNSQFFEKVYQSEMKLGRKSLSPPSQGIKMEIKTEIGATPVRHADEQMAETTKRKLSTSQLNEEVKEKRKPSIIDRVQSPEAVQKLSPIKEKIASPVPFEESSISATPIKKSELASTSDSKAAATKPPMPRFKIGNVGKAKGKGEKRRSNKPFGKKKFKTKLTAKSFKRKPFVYEPRAYENLENVESRYPVGSIGAAFSGGQVPARSNRLKYLQYPSTELSSKIVVDPKSGSRYMTDENGQKIKIVRMRQEEIINCLCSYGEEDGLMIQCELCLCWQHGGCNGIEKESEVPEKYVCYICRNPERARESMKYIHDQDWLYDGQLFHASYHQPSRYANQRADILKQSHTLTGNLLELKRSLHSLNVKINIAANKDHPKMYLWSKKWEQSPPRTNGLNVDTSVKVEPKIEPQEAPLVGANKPLEATDQQKGTNTQSNSTATTENNQKVAENAANAGANNIAQPKNSRASMKRSSNKHALVAPNIPEPEAAIDSVECQHRLLEHIQKEQNLILSRMQTIDAEIMALESMDDHPDTNSKSDFGKTSQMIRLLLNDLTKMKKLAAINESATSNAMNLIDPMPHFNTSYNI